MIDVDTVKDQLYGVLTEHRLTLTARNYCCIAPGCCWTYPSMGPKDADELNKSMKRHVADELIKMLAGLAPPV